MRKPSILAVLIIIAVSCSAFANTLFNGFVYDDIPQVLNNTWIIDLKNIPAIFSSSAWSFLGTEESFHYYRPMMHTIYALEYRLFTLNPLFWHLINILMHACNAVLVFAVASFLLAAGAESEDKKISGGLKNNFPILPFIAAIFFAMHPVVVESVAWVAAIPELSYTLFFLLSLYLYIRSSREESAERSTHSFLLSPSYILSLLFFFVSLFCKEPAIMLPLIFFAYDYARGKRLLSKLMISRYTLFVLLAFLYLYIRSQALGGLAPKFTEHFYLTAFQNILNVGPLVFDYTLALLFPFKFSPFYVFYPVLSIASFTVLYSWALVLVLLAIYIYLYLKRSTAFVAATLLIAPLLPVLYIPAFSTSVFAIRYLYLPVAGLGIIMALVVRRIFLNYRPSPAEMPIKPVSIFLALAVLFSICAFKTVKRNMVWKDDLTLWRETIRLYPDNYHAYLNLGRTYVGSGDKELAKEAYREAIRLNLEFTYPKRLHLAESWYNLGLMQFDTGELDEAITSYNEALVIEVKDALTRDILNNLGNAYATGGQIDEAIMSYERALALDPGDTYVRHNLEAVRKWKRK